MRYIQSKSVAFFNRLAAVLLCAVLCAGLCACGKQPLADSFDESTVQNDATTLIGAINEGSYELAYNTFSDEMKNALSLEDFTSTFSALVQSKGAFRDFRSADVSGAKQDGKDFASCIVISEYENGSLAFTVTYDTDEKVAGLYYQ
jgi:hypothetical protein